MKQGPFKGPRKPEGIMKREVIVKAINKVQREGPGDPLPHLRKPRKERARKQSPAMALLKMNASARLHETSRERNLIQLILN